MQQRRKTDATAPADDDDGAASSSLASSDKNSNSQQQQQQQHQRSIKGKRRRTAAAASGGFYGVIAMVIAVPAMATSLLLYAAFYVHNQNIEPLVIGAGGPSTATSNNAQRRDKNNLRAAVTTTSASRDASSVDYKTGEVWDYHVVFSSGCSIYQDWQSYIFFYHALTSGQPGKVTRIVSGCPDEEAEQLVRKVFKEQIESMAPGRFHVWFTPDFGRQVKPGHNYYFFNKPFGMKHWMEGAMGYGGNVTTATGSATKKINGKKTMVLLLDPDQAILRPFVRNDFRHEDWAHLQNGVKPRTRIEPGKPMGQLYGFALQWKNKVNMSYIHPQGPSPVDKLSTQEAMAGYILGPPYIATADDMYRIVVQWSEFCPRVHDQYPHLLAEMFAYSLAAAHLQLPHQTARTFMVSDVSSGKGEGWQVVDEIPQQEVCSSPQQQQQQVGRTQPKRYLPHVMHFCQRYSLGNYFFAKRRLPKTFLSCNHSLLAEPPSDLGVVSKHGLVAHLPEGTDKTFNAVTAKRNVFALCALIPGVNRAATHFKQRHCSNATANFEKTFFFPKKK